MATPGAGCWPAPALSVLEAEPDLLTNQLPWSGLLGHDHLLHICLQHLVPTGAKQVRGLQPGTMIWDGVMVWGSLTGSRVFPDFGKSGMFHNSSSTRARPGSRARASPALLLPPVLKLKPVSPPMNPAEMEQSANLSFSPLPAVEQEPAGTLAQVPISSQLHQ